MTGPAQRLAAVALLSAAAALGAGCGSDDPPPDLCGIDAGALPRQVEVGAGAFCATARLAVPRREEPSCGDLPADFGGARVAMVGHAGTRWTLEVQRTDGSPGVLCTAVLDERCACSIGRCTNDAILVLDLGTVDRDRIDAVIPAGTYSVELCTR